MLTEATLRKLWPNGDRHIPGLIDAIVASAPAVLPRYGLDSPLVLAQAMAQFSHEFGAGAEPEENLSYTSPARIAAVWPSRFSVGSAIPYVRNPRALANKVYNGRMGNRPGSDDGYNFRGRGGSQVTGREGYAKLAARTGLDLLGHPELVNDPAHFLECSAADFILCGCLPYAQRDDVRGVTHHLNGGYIGLDERVRWLSRWKAALGVTAAPRTAGGSPQYGDGGWNVRTVQDRLVALGYSVGRVDGQFGSATRAAVLAFQADRNLIPTGVVDAATRAALADPAKRPVTESRATATAGDLREAGSVTIANGDNIKRVGMGATALALVQGAGDSGVLDTVKGATDQVGTLRSVVDSAQDVLGWAASHWWIGALVIGFLCWHFGRGVIAARLAAHQTGKDMSR